MSDLIAAVATGNVRSAIGVIRLSGEGAVACVDSVFRAGSGRKMADTPSRRLVYGGVYGQNGALLDMCLCTVSRAPHSYTGEDTAELQCHGSPAALGAILTALFRAGARQALPGEFTRRAFLAGKLDLTEAEAVIDLIDADTVAAVENAAGQLGGAVKRRAEPVYSALLDMTAHFHAVVDWPDEDIEDFEAAKYLDTLTGAESTLAALLDTFDRGRVLREGVRCVLVGRPNVGKSSLLNALLGFDRAIVTAIPGTTRDTVEDACVLGNRKLRLIDTAGIRGAADEVERIGVERSFAAMASAQVILAVLDGSRPLTEEDRAVIQKAAETAPTVLILNKADLPQQLDPSALPEGLPRLPVCAKTGAGLPALSQILAELLPDAPDAPAGDLLTNARQAGEAAAALDGVRAAKAAIAGGVTPDAVLTEIEAALNALGRLTGRALSADVTQRIFARFCVGK